MLMVLGSNAWCNDDLVGVVDWLVWCEWIGIDNSGSLDLELEGSIEGKIKVETVFVIGDGADG